jgi:peroxiredoxin
MSQQIPNENPDERTLADTDESQEERGRIGYGRNERTSSWLLGTVLILVVLALGVYQWTRGGDGDTTDPGGSTSVDVPAVGNPAPDFTLTTFSGDEITLSEQRGKVVIVNFWGSWCEPCKREMPAFQAYWESAPDDVMMIGVGGKQDPQDRSREFAEGFGITYPIGRDSGGDLVATGSIARDYTVTFYPMTYVISPNGVVSSLVIGEMDEADLENYVQKARVDAGTGSSTPQAIENRRRAN